MNKSGGKSTLVEGNNMWKYLEAEKTDKSRYISGQAEWQNHAAPWTLALEQQGTVEAAEGAWLALLEGGS